MNLDHIEDLARVDVPSMRHMTGRDERVDGIKVMHDDLLTLAQSDGCLAAAWALDAVLALLVKIRELEKIENATRAYRSKITETFVEYADLDDNGEEFEGTNVLDGVGEVAWCDEGKELDALLGAHTHVAGLASLD
jgi:hypothetical protein